MADSYIKIIADTWRLRVSHGIAFGSIQGYAVSVYETGKKLNFTVTTTIPTAEASQALTEALAMWKADPSMTILNTELTRDKIMISFNNQVNCANGLTRAARELISLLTAIGASRMDVCPHCGMTVLDGKWKFINMGAYHLHSGCAAQMTGTLEGKGLKKSNGSGSYFTGILGALLGAALGAVMWAAGLHFGYIVFGFGLFIGALCGKGYDLLGGKQGKIALAIVILFSIISVFVGSFASESKIIMDLLATGDYPEYTFGDVPGIIWETIRDDSAYAFECAKKLIIGVLFSILGAIAVHGDKHKMLDDSCVMDLE